MDAVEFGVEEVDPLLLGDKAHRVLPRVRQGGDEAVILPARGQVWSITQFCSVDFTQSRIALKKCIFNKRTIKVCAQLFLTVSWDLLA